MAIHVTVWNEYLHEKQFPEIASIYPKGIHGCIADFLQKAGMTVQTATLEEPEHGLTQDVLDNFATVDEAVEALAKDDFDVASDLMPDGSRMATLHLSVSDAGGDNAIVEYIDGTIMPDYDRFVENGVQYRDDAAYVNTTMDHFEEKARNLQQIMEKTVDSIRDISTAIEESANSVGNAASSTTVLVSNIDTVHSEMETNQSISDRLKGEAGRFKNV